MRGDRRPRRPRAAARLGGRGRRRGRRRRRFGARFRVGAGGGRRRAQPRGPGPRPRAAPPCPGARPRATPWTTRPRRCCVNLLRGAGLDGLAGMRPGPDHPLLGHPPGRHRTPCARPSGSSRSRDPSNDDPRFVRNRVRHELLPLASAVAGRDLVPVLARQAVARGRGRRPARRAGRRRSTRRRRRAGARAGAPGPPGRPAVAARSRRPSPRPGRGGAGPGRGPGPDGATDVAPGRRVRRSRGSPVVGIRSPPGRPVVSAPDDRGRRPRARRRER